MGKGVYKWMAVDRIATTAITFTGNIVLARLLSPFDFGLLAMVAIFIGVAYNASNCGLSDGLINKQRPTATDYSTVFVFNVLMGLAFCVAFILLATPVAEFFGYEELVWIMRAVGLGTLCSTLSLVQETRMRKELRLKQMCLVRVSANFSAVSLGIWLAWAGYGYWGLVSCRVFVTVFTCIYYIAVSRWFPGIRFSIESFKQFFSYGINLMWSYMLGIVIRYINSTALGHRSSVESGLYSQGQKMMEVPFNLTEAIFNWPFFAVAANEPDQQRRHDLCTEMLQWLMLLNAVLGFVLCLAAWPGFYIVFGEKWISAVPVFRILLLFGFATSMKAFFQTIVKLHSRTYIMRNLTFVEFGLQITLLVIAWPFGLNAIAWSQSLAALILLAIYAAYYIRLEKVTLAQFLSRVTTPIIVPSIAFLLSCGAYSLWFKTLPPLLNLATTLAVFFALSIALWEAFLPHPIYRKYRDLLLSKVFKK